MISSRESPRPPPISFCRSRRSGVQPTSTMAWNYHPMGATCDTRFLPINTTMKQRRCAPTTRCHPNAEFTITRYESNPSRRKGRNLRRYEDIDVIWTAWLISGCRMIGIGFSSPKASVERLPGWEQESWAYHGDDGKSFFGESQGQGRPYGPVFGAGDTVGCGVNFSAGSAFFTKNGHFLGMCLCQLGSWEI